MLGLCGGYQMLGRRIADPQGLEGAATAVDGLGLLDVATAMQPAKRLALSKARYLPTGDPVSGYEIHLGQTDGPDLARAWLDIDGRAEGAASADGRVRGCYLHGLFAADAFRAAYLAEIGAQASGQGYDAGIEEVLDRLADHIAAHVDIDRVLQLAADLELP